ncbi:3',5'-cyclic-nucleotide phosphodiesterase [Coemansia thaxteri]|nr:3',5'-cyclic-nucleotide phosphodiesterase [Coemansia thaxteri]
MAFCSHLAADTRDHKRRRNSVCGGVAMSTSHEAAFMRQAAGLGAMNYLVKPISAETVHSLWLNVFSCRTHPQAGGEAYAATPQQAIFHRRIRADSANGACTADTRNAAFEEDFIRQFVPGISSTLPVPVPLTAAAAAVGEARGECGGEGKAGCEEEEEDDDDDLFASSPRAELLRARLLDWSFCPYEMERRDLIDSAVIMIMDSAACVDLRLRAGRVRKFVTILESAYYDKPYLYFRHAVDVTQSTFYMLHTLGLFGGRGGARRASLRSPGEASFPVRSILRPTDAVALVVASMCHDLGHPGLNNAFMVRAHTQLAELYNDQSVLENFHAACFSMVMSYFFRDFSGSASGAPLFDYEEFRRIAVHAILATDMARHFEFIGKCKAQHERFLSRANLPLTAPQHEAERAQLAASILKCADISNIVRPFHIAQRWTQRLNREVTLQGNIEESLGLTRSIVVDAANIPAAQIAFYESCGRPLFAAVADLVPELRFMPEQLENNIRNWHYIKANQKVPEVPYALKHSSAFDLSICTRSASSAADSAPDFLAKRSSASLLTTMATTPSSSTIPPYTASSATTAVENLHHDHLLPAESSEELQHHATSAPKLLVAGAGVPSPPHSQRSAAAKT